MVFREWLFYLEGSCLVSGEVEWELLSFGNK